VLRPDCVVFEAPRLLFAESQRRRCPLRKLVAADPRCWTWRLITRDVLLTLPVDLQSSLIEGHAQELEHSGADPVFFPDQADQQVLGADIAVPEERTLIDCQLDDPIHGPGQIGVVLNLLCAGLAHEPDGRTNL